jgi:hypothetical protein
VFEAYASLDRWQDAAQTAARIKASPQLAAGLCPVYRSAQTAPHLPGENVRTRAAQLLCP